MGESRELHFCAPSSFPLRRSVRSLEDVDTSNLYRIGVKLGRAGQSERANRLPSSPFSLLSCRSWMEVTYSLLRENSTSVSEHHRRVEERYLWPSGRGSRGRRVAGADYFQYCRRFCLSRLLRGCLCAVSCPVSYPLLELPLYAKQSRLVHVAESETGSARDSLGLGVGRVHMQVEKKRKGRKGVVYTCSFSTAKRVVYSKGSISTRIRRLFLFK